PTNTIVDLTFQSDDYEAYTVKGISTVGIDSNDGFQVPPIPVTLTRIYGSRLTPAEAKIRLARAKAIAIATGALDLFFYNLEVFRDAFRNDFPVSTELQRFETETRGDEKFKGLFTPEQELRIKLFRDLINYQQGRPLSPELRSDATPFLKLMID